MVDLTIRSNFTAANVAKETFAPAGAGLNALNDIRDTYGYVTYADVVEIQSEFSIKMARNQMTKEQAIAGFTKKLENADILNLNQS